MPIKTYFHEATSIEQQKIVDQIEYQIDKTKHYEDVLFVSAFSTWIDEFWKRKSIRAICNTIPDDFQKYYTYDPYSRGMSADDKIKLVGDLENLSLDLMEQHEQEADIDEDDRYDEVYFQNN